MSSPPPNCPPDLVEQHCRNGRLYLTSLFHEKDAVKALGARWDPDDKHWYVPSDKDWTAFRQWLPIPGAARRGPPAAFGQQLALYYLSLLEQADPREMGNNKVCLDGVTFDALTSGQLPLDTETFPRFWKAAGALHDGGLSPLVASDNEGEVDSIGVFVAFGFAAGRGEREVLLVLPALLTETGSLLGAQDMPPVINEAYFAPQERPLSPLLGTLDELHAQLSALDWPSDPDWSSAWSMTQRLFTQVSAAGLALASVTTDRGRPLSIWLVPFERNDLMVRNLKTLYDQLIITAPEATPLYAATCQPAPPRPPLSLVEQQRLAWRHTGHMSHAFGLDINQREAAMHLLATDPGKPLAVSGPPGTGKTACLQGIIANAVVNAVVETPPNRLPVPPVMIASSATNQAVTNIIKSFGDIADVSAVPTLSSRWLPPVTSYGWYFASRSAADKTEYQDFQLLGRDRGDRWRYQGAASDLGDTLKDDNGLAQLAGGFLRAFRQNFPDHHGAGGVLAATRHLRATLVALAIGEPSGMNLRTALACRELVCERVAQAGLPVYRAAQTRLAKKQRRDTRMAARLARCAEATDTADADIAALVPLMGAAGAGDRASRAAPWWTRLLTWLTRRRHRHARQALAEHLYVDGASMADGMPLLTQADQRLSSLRAAKAAAVRRQARLADRWAVIKAAESPWIEEAQRLGPLTADMETAIAWLPNLARAYLPASVADPWARGLQAGLNGALPPSDADAHAGWCCGHALVTGGPAAAETLAALIEQLIDRTIRRRCFDLAARYWEGRWLMATAAAQGVDEPLVEGIRRQCMLAPVIVGTAYTLPALFKLSPTTFELSAADLLIIDEAGQADPAVAMGLFALAQRALVVGDVEQLKPIWRVRVPQDIGFLRRSGLATHAGFMERRGLRASSGSAMAAAQKASAYSADDGRGITLVQHYRCRPTIIEFCNRLVYDRLQPLVPITPEAAQPLFHPMTYVGCDGRASRERGSVVNRAEAEELVGWLMESRGRIEQHYNRDGPVVLSPGDAGYQDIGDLVGIVVPFTAQERAIRARLSAALRAAGEMVDEADPDNLMARIKIGTVHRLQGAERPLVLFSATNTPDDGGSPFMNANPDMLNVAVSRAQDAFVLFGHPGLFFSASAQRAGNHSPSAVLGRYMTAYGKRLYPRRLIVVESPNKIASIEDALGRDCAVVAAGGHFREMVSLDIPTATPHWDIAPGKDAMIADILTRMADVDELVIATDDDREGEAIGWHLVTVLRERIPLDGVVLSRMVFHAVTAPAITAGFAARVPWTHTRRAQAAVTRAIIDRAIGEVMSREVTQRLNAQGVSGRVGVGRVTTALLHLLDAQAQGSAQDGDTSWQVRVEVGDWDGQHSVGMWVVDSHAADAAPRVFADKAAAQAVADRLEAAYCVETTLSRQTVTLGPAAPAGTAEVLIAAFEQHGITPPAASRLLQDLYEGHRKAVDVGRAEVPHG